jgi:eukaryotic-like serine/threonine-protein kinase
MQTFGSPESPDPLLGRELLRGLRLVERLGATNEGPLYRGQYSSPGPPVAVTVLQGPWNSPDRPSAGSLSDRHWQQLRRACQIQHPNVAGLLDVGETPDGIIYAVAELLSGELVSDILAVSGGIPPPQAVDICAQVAEGLRAAHAAGVVHGSVSPQTVLVTGGGERLTVKVIGFDFTRRPEAHGDPRAETPWVDDRLDPTDDIVGVGVLLHCLLTGSPPDGERRARAMPEALHRIIDRCLGGHGRHYPTMAALADDLARQAAAGVRPPRRFRRRPLALAAIAGSVSLLAAGLWFGWARFRDESTDARSEVGTGALDAVPDSQPPPAANQVPRPADSAAGTARRPPTRGARPGDSSAASAPAAVKSARDSSAALSPFRRSHPWAAEPKGKVYFPSSCPQALRASDLLYFRTEAEARTTGRTRSPDPGCS